MNSIKAYLQDSYHELVHKTSWPSWDELQRTAIMVAVAAVIIALMIFAMDKVISTALKAFYELF